MRSHNKVSLYKQNIVFESFVNMADKDYINARFNFRNAMIEHFYWNALQAIEKYLKSILLFNGRSSKKQSHFITKILKKILTVNLQYFVLSEDSKKFIETVESHGMNRYFSTSTYIKGDELYKLDRVVWELRRYCYYPEVCIINEEDSYWFKEVDNINDHYKYRPNCSINMKSILYKVLEDRKHKLHSILVWNNPYFTLKKRIKIKGTPLKAENTVIDAIIDTNMISVEEKKEIIDWIKNNIKLSNDEQKYLDSLM